MTAQVGCNTRSSITSANSTSSLHHRYMGPTLALETSLFILEAPYPPSLLCCTPARVVVAGCGNSNLAMNNRNSFVNLINLMRFILVLTLFIVSTHGLTPLSTQPPLLQDLYGVRSDLGNLYKALGRLEEAKVCMHMWTRVCVSVESPFSH